MTTIRNIIVLLIVAAVFFTIGFKADKIMRSGQLTKQTIAHSEKLIGLNFNKAERDSMLDALNDQLKNFVNIQKYSLDNGIAPSLVFNPLPEDFELQKGPSAIKFSDYSSAKLPGNVDDLAYYSIGQLGHLIKSGQISSVELTRFFLKRLKKYGPELECVITLTEERALEEARLADKELASGIYRGTLHGIPYGIKDLFAVKGYKTTWGATPYKDQIINEDAAVVKKLRSAGAVLVAKLTLGALAWGDVWYGGKTRNPWNKEQGSSGSSAGSASAVSAGLVPFAIGTETWGSIVSPSTICGVTGLRPTFGRVSRSGVMALSWSMDKIGPICHYVEDAAIVFNAIYGPGDDEWDDSVIDAPFNYNADLDISRLKIGYIKSDFETDYGFRAQDSITLVKLRQLGFDLQSMSLPDLPVNDLGIILSAEAGAAFDELTRSNRDDLLVRQVKNAWPNVFRSSRFIPAVEYINANRIRRQLINQMDKILEAVDIYLAPSWQGDNLLLTNLTGHPCVVLPNGFSKEGTPTSISFMGKLFEEGRLLAVAKFYQDRTDFHLKHPELNK